MLPDFKILELDTKKYFEVSLVYKDKTVNHVRYLYELNMSKADLKDAAYSLLLSNIGGVGFKSIRQAYQDGQTLEDYELSNS